MTPMICSATSASRGHGLACSLDDGHAGIHCDDRYIEFWCDAVVSTSAVERHGAGWWVIDHSGPVSGPYRTQRAAESASESLR